MYRTYDDMSAALANAKVKGLLIDANVAAHRPSLFGSSIARVNKIVKGTKSYGFVVPNTKEVNAKAIKCFRSYVEQQKQSISDDIANNAATLPVIIIISILFPENTQYFLPIMLKVN